MDVHDKKTRSYNMSRIKAKDTAPEMLVRRMCHGIGLRYRLHQKDLPGKPDLVFSRHRTVIFVNGCYWHLHSCAKGQVFPKNNGQFWQDKREATVERDKKKSKALEDLGWRVLTYWACELDDDDVLNARIRKDFSC